MIETEEIKSIAKRILKQGQVKYLIGYKRSLNGLMASPVFIKSPEEVEQLIWEATCIYNLSRFLVDEKQRKDKQKKPDTRPVAIFAKGCDTRAINVLIQEKYIERKDVYIIGLSCENSGVVDINKINQRFKAKKPQRVKFDCDNRFLIVSRFGNIKVPVNEFLADRCLECKANYPVIYDIVLGDQVKKKWNNDSQKLDDFEKRSNESKWMFWQEKFSQCIRCYACRSICPLCYCNECVVDSTNLSVTPETTAEEKAQKPKWIEKSPLVSENLFYHLLRALHLAGRCVDCGECERVCPVEIPLRLLNKKMEKEAHQLFKYESGFDPNIPSLISNFKDDDPGDFII